MKSVGLQKVPRIFIVFYLIRNGSLTTTETRIGLLLKKAPNYIKLRFIYSLFQMNAMPSSFRKMDLKMIIPFMRVPFMMKSTRIVKARVFLS